MGFSDKSYLSVFLVFVVKLASFLMFTLCEENTVKCLEDFS